MSEAVDCRLAVLTRRGSWYGEYVLRLLAQRNVFPALVLVENTPMRARLRMCRRLAGRIGWVDAIRYNTGFWGPVFKRFIGLDRATAFPYDRYSNRVMEAGDINATRFAAGLIEHGIDRVLLAHSGIIRKPILSIDGLWIINSHPAVLPRMRGVDVIRWSILEEVPTAVTVHVVNDGVDTGPILDSETVEPLPEETLTAFEGRVTERATEKLVDCGLAGPAAFPAPLRQSRDQGRQYYLMPFKYLPLVEKNFASMKRSRAFRAAA